MERRCAHCGVVLAFYFDDRRSDARYCSTRCRVATLAL
jgi:hypothetical protein